ncbi:hypothetical protein K1X12_09935 [Hyphomonas sp. WL0036]|uniref:hypothetical protein n=1 Tax=Hyphomonas sediminis TaxID=2866160 RepID=UPI001C7FD86E|nr:hypothetical protein [Hyphomonas sediminis]MBY9067219.1 hypothetical protein [Hyphomonas sediminis]
MKLQSFGFAVALSSVLALSACGGGDNDAYDENGYAGPEAASPAATSNDEGGKAKKVKCPAKINKTLTGPDIAGFKLGMTLAEAENALACQMPDGLVTYENEFFNTRNLNTGTLRLERQRVISQAGDNTECSYGSYDAMQKCGAGNRQWDFISEKITLATPGVPGKQTVQGVWRTQNWKEGEMPAKAAVLAALTEKYGPHQSYEGRDANYYGYVNEYHWVTDSEGNVLSEAHPMLHQCGNGVSGRGDESQSWTNGCGVSITAMVRTFRSNPDVVEELSIGMMDQTGLFEYGEAFQNDLLEIENKRRADELEKAQGAQVEL